MKEAIKHSNFRKLLNKLKEAKKSGGGNFSIHEIAYDLKINEKKTKYLFWQTRVWDRRNHFGLNLKRDWGQTETGHRCIIGYTITPNEEEGIIALIDDKRITKREIEGRKGGLEDEVETIKETLSIPRFQKKEIKKLIMYSDSR